MRDSDQLDVLALQKKKTHKRAPNFEDGLTKINLIANHSLRSRLFAIGYPGRYSQEKNSKRKSNFRSKVC